ncbi:hypothetical protein [Arcanobacterium pinnipediorum]|uniref:Alcohol dehydrogenase n=1 Tax=Arcanobacterium pinnipediorum TaxID=1503041 RepID=A0ABY5AHF0_9ACTO|nr:hypothetical protein [Arcanobacterium pinnipediorum]USR79136.1 hypothetical protein NG665_07060 [Arcanobacterium pinnipediorum]
MMGIFAGIVLGLISGTLSLVAYSGPLDQPWIGLVIASALVACGSWLVSRLAGVLGWVFYALSTLGVTIWLLFFGSADTALYTDHQWATHVWLVLLPLALITAPLIEKISSRSAMPASQVGTVGEPRNEE